MLVQLSKMSKSLVKKLKFVQDFEVKFLLMLTLMVKSSVAMQYVDH